MSTDTRARPQNATTWLASHGIQLPDHTPSDLDTILVLRAIDDARQCDTDRVPDIDQQQSIVSYRFAAPTMRRRWLHGWEWPDWAEPALDLAHATFQRAAVRLDEARGNDRWRSWPTSARSLAQQDLRTLADRVRADGATPVTADTTKALADTLTATAAQGTFAGALHTLTAAQLDAEALAHELDTAVSTVPRRYIVKNTRLTPLTLSVACAYRPERAHGRTVLVTTPELPARVTEDDSSITVVHGSLTDEQVRFGMQLIDEGADLTIDGPSTLETATLLV